MSVRDELKNLRREVLEVRDMGCFKKCKRWTKDPLLTGEHLYQYNTLEDLNERRLHDAEILGGVCANRNPKTILEIGTAEGHTTALLAQNAPQATVHTVNILPEEIRQGGKLVTDGFSREKIGWYYRQQNCSNVRQIWANTATWEPDIGPIDVAFIDGCHDAEFVYNDTRKVLKHAHKGTVILWHDFNLELVDTYPWIAAACRGVERLFEEGLIEGRVLHLRDSWVGYYVVMR